MAQDGRYPFDGGFVKDTLPFPIFMPAVLGWFKIRIFFLFILKRLIFAVFIELPFHYFAYKIIILTPIWPVQLVLGS
jgi:hypothetical protein